VRGDCERKQRIDLPDEGWRRVLDRDIGASRRRLSGDQPRHALFQDDDVPMEKPQLSGRKECGADSCWGRGRVSSGRQSVGARAPNF